MKTAAFKPARHILSLVLILCCTVTMSACSLFGDFDAAAYTRSFLDAMSKNDFKEYAEITKSTEEDAKKEYETLLNNNVSSLLSTVTVTDETKANLKEMFHSVYSKWSYEVGEAVKNDDGSFTVPVKLRKLTAFKGALSETMDRMMAKADELEDLDEAAMYDVYYQTFIDIVNETVAKGEYAEPAEVSVKISPTTTESSGSYDVYTMDTDSIQALYTGAMDIDAIQEEASSLMEAE